MLLPDQLEPPRPLPAELPLVRARAPPWMPEFEVLGSLPTVLGAEDGARVLHARVQRARAPRPAPFVSVQRVAQEVVVAVRLARKLGRVAGVAVDRAEAP